MALSANRHHELGTVKKPKVQSRSVSRAAKRPAPEPRPGPHPAPGVAAVPVVPQLPRILPYVLSPGFYVLLAIAAVLVVVGITVTAADPDGHRSEYFLMAIGAPALPSLWVALRTVFSGAPDSMLSLRAITTGVFFATMALTLVAVITMAVPAVTQQVYDTRNPKTGFHYFFAADLGHPVVGALMAVGLAGFTIALLVALAAWVLVVLPVVAFLHKRAFAQQNLLDTAPEFAEDNALAGRALAILMILIFLIPSLIVVGSANASSDNLWAAFAACWRVFQEPQEYWGDMAWVVGVVLIAVGVFLVVLIRIKQHPDIAARDAMGINAIGDVPKPRKKK